MPNLTDRRRDVKSYGSSNFLEEPEQITFKLVESTTSNDNLGQALYWSGLLIKIHSNYTNLSESPSMRRIHADEPECMRT